VYSTRPNLILGFHGCDKSVAEKVVRQEIMIEKLYKICEALAVRFPGNSDPFLILARLMEESGELAEQVHLRESVGRKRQIHGEPDDEHLAK